MTILSVNDISLSFGPKEILKDVSFALNENDRLGIVGSNGCGKSTLLSLLLGRTEPTTGSVYINQNTTVGILTQDCAFELADGCGGTVCEQMYAAYPEFISAEARMNELTEWMEAHSDESETAGYLSRAKEYSDLHDRYVADGGSAERRSAHAARAFAQALPRAGHPHARRADKPS